MTGIESLQRGILEMSTLAGELADTDSAETDATLRRVAVDLERIAADLVPIGGRVVLSAEPLTSDCLAETQEPDLHLRCTLPAGHRGCHQWA